MRILIVDDEHLAVQHMCNLVKKAKPEAEIIPFRRADDALESAAEVHYDVAFLDINLREMTGIDLAKKFQELQPRLNIIFVTGYNEYAMEAFHLHACGYILKPVSADLVADAFNHLTYPVEEEKQNLLEVQTFGYFDVLDLQQDNKPIKFRLAKAKEMFAILVDKRGALCSNEEIIRKLWGDEDEEVDHSEYFKRIRQCMLTTLADIGCEDVLITAKNEIGVVPEKLNCDYFDYLNAIEAGEEPRVIPAYMTQYKWSEETFMMLHGLMKQKRT